jgi:hypothetical protein
MNTILAACPTTVPPPWSDTAAAFYVSGQQRSDDVQRLGPALRRSLRRATSVIDLGAGTGALGAAAIPTTAHWTAVEPNSFMYDLLQRAALVRGTAQVINACWQDSAVAALPTADAVLAARIPGLSEDPIALWQRCAALAQQCICWVVGANDESGSGGLSSFLPSWLRDPRRSSSVEQTLDCLSGIAPTPQVTLIDWTWRQIFPDFASAFLYFATRVRNPGEVEQQRRLEIFLRTHLRKSDDGFLAEATRRSAVCTWRMTD